MTGQIAARVRLAMAGGLGGALVWAVFKAGEKEWIGHYPAFALFGLILVGFGALLAMAGPLGVGRALPRAFGLGAGVAGLICLTALRWDEAEDIFNGPIPALALLVVAALPVPFLIAAARTSWRDYPTLFLEAWAIVLRGAAAAAFTGLVWLVIYLSDEVLRIVRIDAIRELLSHEVVPMVLTGAVFGLGLAGIHDLARAFVALCGAAGVPAVPAGGLGGDGGVPGPPWPFRGLDRACPAGFSPAAPPS